MSNHFLKTILPNFETFYKDSLFTDVSLVCSDGQISSYKLLLASISDYLKGPLKDSPDCDFIFLPDVEIKCIESLHNCLLSSALDIDQFGLLSSVFHLLGIQFSFLTCKLLEGEVDCEVNDCKKDVDQTSGKECLNEMRLIKRGRTNTSENGKKNDENPKEEDLKPESADTKRPKRNIIRPKKFESSLLVAEENSDDDQQIETRRYGSESVQRSLGRKQRRRRSLNFICDECQRHFCSKQALNNHSLLHKNDRKFTCEICCKKFVASGALYNHCRLIHNTDGKEAKLIECKFCDKNFNNLSNFERHMRALHFEFSDKKRFPCQECPKSFTDPSGLSAHKKIHSQIKPHHCKECQKKFTTAAQLRVHLRIHEGIRPFCCSLCDRTFITKGQLKSHELHRHIGVQLSKDNLCTECGSTFVKSHDLKVHMLKHTGELPFKCDHCEKGFRSRRNLRNHLRIHTGERPYSCDTCGKSFVTTSGMRHHIYNRKSCRVNDADSTNQKDQHSSEEMQTVVLVGQEGRTNIISITDASGLTLVEIPGSLVEIPASVQLRDTMILDLQPE